MSVLSIKNMQVTSPAFKDGEYIPAKYSCTGKSINPPIVVKNLPEKTVSIALIIEDPDATKGTFDHWIIWNIKPGEEIHEGTAPGTEGKNGSGGIGYTGPCPPIGTGIHHYYFKLFALDKMLALATGADKKQLQEMMEGHILGQAELIGLYKDAK